ncbi:MAG: crossover junction endodeoxyribonuclease RuvC [Bacteroidales bacterium]|jgi:crossover junction endodeoxyribonuclease RuvC|nr:crossover junction endodeoxyribonuclease RuvC [Bacteroidales bacterium]MCI1785488.1 crossover junction endodeoxyribonuclease RuvC [Bacteroidales bacterium]
MITERVILGIDPGTNVLGFGVIHVCKSGPGFVDMGVIDLRKEKDPYDKLRRIFSEVGALCDKFKPDDMSIESPFYGRNAQVIFKLGRAQGAAITAASIRNIHVYEYAPRKAKVAITGSGSASKEQVCTMIQRILDIKETEKFLDATDALAIAMCHYFQLSNPLSSTVASTNWTNFIKANPERVCKVLDRGKNSSGDFKPDKDKSV